MVSSSSPLPVLLPIAVTRVSYPDPGPSNISGPFEWTGLLEQMEGGEVSGANKVCSTGVLLQEV